MKYAKYLGIISIIILITLSSGCIFISGFVDTLSLDNENNIITDGNGNIIHNATPVIFPDIIGTVIGPKETKRGQNLTVEYKVTNKGIKAVYNVSVEGQSIDEYLGTLKPGETKKFTHIVYIHTPAELKEEYGPDAVECNPYPIGGDNIYYRYSNGQEHIATFDWIEIKLI
ncbi:hypothetical protein [Methanobacterium sp. ACI-7]|uniref:hypothetical protein n=1 Tax=unclassified Methanobacterium TaxID=2627676 RepID=UPI0039C42E09